MANIDIDLTFEELDRLIEQEEQQRINKNDNNNLQEECDDQNDVVTKSSILSDSITQDKFDVISKYANGKVATELTDKTRSILNKDTLNTIQSQNDVVEKSTSPSSPIPENKIRVTWKYANGDVVTEHFDKTKNVLNKNSQEKKLSQNDVVIKSTVPSLPIPENKIRVTWKYANGDIETEHIGKTGTVLNKNLQEKRENPNDVAIRSTAPSNPIAENITCVTRKNTNGDAVTKVTNTNGYLSAASCHQPLIKVNDSFKEKIDSTTVLPQKNFDDKTKRNNSFLRKFFNDKGISYVDNTNKKGAFWVIGGIGLLHVFNELRNYGIYFRYCERGSKATQGKPGWWCSL